ncbi:MAG TPA: hypothetical protein VK810_06565 [Dongiaceae bacterium]|nr:hypothetical protein [Dongiaceae bacterium]
MKELYLAEFNSFFKAGSSSWTPGVNAGKGVAGVTLIEWVILIVIAMWIELSAGERFLLLNFHRWQIWIATFILSFMNYYILVIRSHGIKFEREFNGLKKSKKILLIISCRVLELVTVAIFLYTISVYHRFFHIIPKSGF